MSGREVVANTIAAFDSRNMDCPADVLADRILQALEGEGWGDSGMQINLQTAGRRLTTVTQQRDALQRRLDARSGERLFTVVFNNVPPQLGNNVYLTVANRMKIARSITAAIEAAGIHDKTASLHDSRQTIHDRPTQGAQKP